MRLGFNNIGGIVIKLRVMRASRRHKVPFALAYQYAIRLVY